MPPRNHNDPNGYYRFLSIPPWSTWPEIKLRCRKMLSMYHPDGSMPDSEMYAYTAMVYEVLRSPRHKALYEATPPGKVYVDRQIIESAKEGDIELEAQDPERPDPIPDTTNGWYWSYFSDRPLRSDRGLAMAWYDLLLEAAYEANRRSTIRLYMTVQRVNGVVGEEVYVYKYEPSLARARQLVELLPDVRGVG